MMLGMFEGSTCMPHVLVADGDGNSLQNIVALLEHARYQVSRASDGKSAKALVSQHGAQIDLITTDLNMPDFDGVEFLTYLAGVNFVGKFAIISGAVPTVAAAAAKLATVYRLDFIGFLIKPVTAAGLDSLLSGAGK